MSRQYQFASESFPTQKALRERLAALRAAWPIGAPITGQDDALLRAIRPDRKVDFFTIEMLAEGYKPHRTTVGHEGGNEFLVGMNHTVTSGAPPTFTGKPNDAAKRFSHMQESIPAIPTRYNGIQFRSRLEAKWAAFFDGMGWRWEYEPLDLRGWIPDFALIGHKTTLVEVRPITNLTEPLAVQAIERAKAANDSRGVLFVGVEGPGRWYPLDEDKEYGHVITFGVACADDENVEPWGEDFGSRPTILLSKNNRNIGFAASCSGEDRINKEPEDGPFSFSLFSGESMFERVQRAWAEAGNRTQWKPPR